MEPVHSDSPPRSRGRRFAIWAAVALGVWAALWLLARSTAPGVTQPPPRAQPSGAGGKSSISPTFSHNEGWSVRTGGVLVPGSRGLPMAIAANVPLARQDVAFIAANGLSESAPTATLSSLQPRGVVILAVLPFPFGGRPAPPHFGDFPDRSLPLQLSDARVNRQWQSQPRQDSPEYDIWGRVEGTYVEVSVYFGTPRPSAATYASAQAELARLVLPPKPARETPLPANWTAGNAGTLTIQTPPGWTFSGNPAPLVELAEGNWPFPNGGSCGPEAALRSMPRDGAFIWLSEIVLGPREGGFPPRPARFSLRGLRPIRRECSGAPYLIQFRDHGRAFQAQIAFGPDASAATKTEAMRSLSSLRVGSGAD
jgi:hypothetical protein